MSENLPESRDPQLMQIARKRAGFRWHLLVYVCVNSFLILKNLIEGDGLRLKTALYWGVGLLIHWFMTYKGKIDFEEEEYQKLLDEKRRQDNNMGS